MLEAKALLIAQTEKAIEEAQKAYKAKKPDKNP